MRFRCIAAATAACGLLAVPAGASAATKVVTMGLPLNAQKTFNQKLGADVNDFFPHGITVRAGDKVRFVPTGFHTVNLPKRGGGPLAFLAPNGTASGVTDAAGAAYWFNGQPTLGFNPPLVTKPGFGKSFKYNGSKQVESGLPLSNKPKPMTVAFTKAGSYTYFCDLHPGMKGTVRVLAKSKKAPSAKADKKALKAQLARDEKIAKQLAKTKTASGTVDVGVAGAHGVEVYTFLPGSITVPAGTTLKFQMSKHSFEAHTATTGPGDPEKAPSSFLGKLAASFTSPAIDPAATYPSDPPGAPASLTPQSHGNGFWNSGVMDTEAKSPLPPDSSVTFSAAGTYQFYCLIHPFMHGTVVVQ
jgi:plastocyanin